MRNAFPLCRLGAILTELTERRFNHHPFHPYSRTI